jgi:hypothetical protein
VDAGTKRPPPGIQVLVQTQRNDPCPCGSGEKYKRCCEGKRGLARVKPRTTMIVGAAALIAAAGALAFSLNRGSSDDVPMPIPVTSQQPLAPATSAPATSAPVQQAPATGAPVAASKNLPQPPGMAPAGQVWSPEHGHWHKAEGAQNPVVVQTSTAPVGSGPVPVPNAQRPVVVNYPQPDGPVPPGKIWSPLHGHWHDMPKDLPARAKPGEVVRMDIPQPDGPVPPGKVWSKEHGHWHDLPKQ